MFSSIHPRAVEVAIVKYVVCNVTLGTRVGTQWVFPSFCHSKQSLLDLDVDESCESEVKHICMACKQNISNS